MADVEEHNCTNIQSFSRCFSSWENFHLQIFMSTNEKNSSDRFPAVNSSLNFFPLAGFYEIRWIVHNGEGFLLLLLRLKRKAQEFNPEFIVQFKFLFIIHN